jgi:lysophospholipase L1-like esterase
MPLKVLVLGHSFVRRLETDIINQVHPVLSPKLGLVNKDVVVQYLRFSGGNIFSLLDDPHNRLDATLRAFPADVIILQIGGNDIDHKEFFSQI